MRKQILFLLLLLCGTLAQAQSIEQHIRQQREGVGLVNLHISESVYHAMIVENSALEEDKAEKTLDEQLKELENFKNAPKTRVMGYRVQLYGGSNSRESRLAAQNANDKAKRLFPEFPVYTHFESPRWVCKIGNFTDREEANEVWKRAKANGFAQAIVVRDQILVVK
jgi:hypothetical protein